MHKKKNSLLRALLLLVLFQTLFISSISCSIKSSFKSGEQNNQARLNTQHDLIKAESDQDEQISFSTPEESKSDSNSVIQQNSVGLAQNQVSKTFEDNESKNSTAMTFEQMHTYLKLAFPSGFNRTLIKVAQDSTKPGRGVEVTGIRENLSLEQGTLLDCPAELSQEQCAFNQCMKTYDCNGYSRGYQGAPINCGFRNRQKNFEVEILPNLGNGYGTAHPGTEITMFYPFHYPKSASVFKHSRYANVYTYNCNFESAAEYRYTRYW